MLVGMVPTIFVPGRNTDVTTPLAHASPPQFGVFPLQICVLGVEPTHCHPDRP